MGRALGLALGVCLAELLFGLGGWWCWGFLLGGHLGLVGLSYLGLWALDEFG